MKYIMQFNTHTGYETYINGSQAVLPNVSYCVDNNDVHYNPWIETRIVAKFNITDTTNPTPIIYSNASQFSEIEIDGVIQPSVVSSYTFSTTGEHTIKYTLVDPTAIAAQTFYYYSSVTSITIPISVTSIGNDAFSGTRITSIVIPNNVTTINNNTFRSCKYLANVTIPNTVTSIGQYAFNDCDALTNINIPDSVTSINQYAFQDCDNITSITLSDNVTLVGSYSFDNCDALTNVTIGSGVTTIGTAAFRYCSNLTSITIQATTPPTLNNANAFGNTNNCPIYVPSASVATYKAATNWKSSAIVNRIQAIP